MQRGMRTVAEPANGNGFKALAIAVAIGALTGSAGTYKVADDYSSTVCNLRIESAVNADRLSRLERRRSPLN